MSWVAAPLKHLVAINPETLRENTSADLEFRYIEISNIGRGKLHSEPEPLTFAEAPSRARRVLAPGDTIISTVRTYLRAVWTLATADDDLVASTGFACLRPSYRVNAGFLGWLTQSDPVVEEVVARSVGVSYPAISADTIGTIKVALPPLSQQRAIADYLNKEVARIDALIEKKQRIASLVLDRFRSHLDFAFQGSAAAPRTRLRHLVRLATSGSRGWGEYYADGGPLFLRIGDLSHDHPGISLDACAHVNPPPGTEGVRATVRPGDVLVGITADIGAVGLAPASIGVAYVSQHVCLLRPREDVIPEWLAWALLTSDAQQQLRLMSYGGTKVGLGLDDVRSLILACPSTADQERIARKIWAESIRAQRLRGHCEAQVRLLKDRRQALITAAVTGQFDVSESA